jgi:hypothetical protein
VARGLAPFWLVLVSVALAALSSLDRGGDAQTGPVRNPANGHYYELVSSGGISWTAARVAAGSRTHLGLQGYLATLTSDAEHTFVVQTFVPSINIPVWLGGEQPAGSAEPAGGWRWITGEAWSYTKWDPGEPNDQGNEDALAMIGRGTWNDAPRGYGGYAGYIVEYGAVSPPPPPPPPPPAITFAPGVGYPVIHASDLTAADLDGDGNSDVFGGEERGFVFILYGNADGTFRPAVVIPSGQVQGSNVHQVLPADLNGDGRPELVVTLPDESVLALHPNLGGRRFGPPVRIPGGAFCNGVAAADFNRDGRIDLATDNYTAGTMSVMINLGGGSFAAPVSYGTLPSGSQPSKITTADFNRDGWSDLAMSAYSPSRIFVYLNDRAGRFLPANAYSVGSTSSCDQVITADFNQDGNPDLAAANTSVNGSVQVLFGRGDGSFVVRPGASAGDTPTLIQAGDLNGDGAPDVAVPNFRKNYFGAMQNDGAGTLGSAVSHGSGVLRDVISLAVADFNNDGAADVAVASQGNAQVVVFLNTTVSAVLPAPSMLQATPVSSSTLALTWQDNSSREDGFQVERSVDGGSTFSLRTTTGPNRTTFSDGGLASNTSYVYRIRAFAGAQTSGFTAPVTGLTLPAAPLNLDATATGAQTVRVSWGDPNPTRAATQVERSGDGGVTFAPLATLPPTTDPAGSNIWVDANGLAAGRSYQYRLRHTNASGASAFVTSPTVVTPAPPAAPVNLVALAVPGGVGLSWDDRSTTENGFVVERLVPGAAWLIVVSLPADATRFTDRGVQPLTTYYYRVLAQNAAGPSAPSNVAEVTTLPLPPNAPSELLATGVYATRTDLRWLDRSTDETGFVVERLDPDQDWHSVLSAGADVTMVSDVGLLPNTKYQYRVVAVNAGGRSAPTDPLTVTTLPLPPDAPTGLVAAAIAANRVDIRWTDRSDNETGFAVERQDPAGAWRRLAVIAPDTTAYSDAAVTPATHYVYRVLALNAGGTSAPSDPVDVVTLPLPPNAPSGLTATVLSATEVELRWTDRSDNETQFVVERQDGSAEWVRAATVGANMTSHRDTSAVSGRSYRYRVSARNSGGDSAPSNEAEALIPTGGRLQVTPASLSFGVVAAGRTKTLQFRVANTGRGPLAGFVVGSAAPFRVASGGGAFSLAPRQAAIVKVEFTPPAVGSFNGIVGVSSTDPAAALVQVRLTGRRTR